MIDITCGIDIGIQQDISIIPGTYITFRRDYSKEKGVTQVWTVDDIGVVKWFGRWRKYSFFPNADSVYEETCLREIAEFCQQLTKAHRAKNAAAKLVAK